MKFSIFRYNPERDKKPYMQAFEIDLKPTDRMLLDVILRIKLQDDSLTIRNPAVKAYAAPTRSISMVVMDSHASPQCES